MSRLIRGERDADGNARVYVDDELLAPGSALWHTSLCLRNLSPTGPEWGYDGRGPAQLALVILLAVTDTEEAQRFYPLFRSGVLAGLRTDRWTLQVELVRRWLERIRELDHQAFAVSAEPDEAGGVAVRIKGLAPVKGRPHIPRSS